MTSANHKFFNGWPYNSYKPGVLFYDPKANGIIAPDVTPQNEASHRLLRVISLKNLIIKKKKKKLKQCFLRKTMSPQPFSN